MEKANLGFKHFGIKSLNFEVRNPNSISVADPKVDFRYKVSKENQDEILGEIKVELKDEKAGFTLNFLALGFFLVEGEIDPKIRKNYLNISIPSIMYPYVRSFVSAFCLQAGMPPQILPTINFGAENYLRGKEAPKKKPKS